MTPPSRDSILYSVVGSTVGAFGPAPWGSLS